tara:strand:- start:258626 stop:259600 length:975 start_codon:yes stop_codon:yes gene_type:complete
MSIGKITRVQLRDVWKHEAHHFTTWLADNIDVINECTGLSLSSVEREQPAGPFSVDLVAENSDGDTVVIENQLERSDHDHLGKLLTYLTAYEAKSAIWIVSDARPEHTATVSWLNKTTDVNFFLLKAEAIQINDSQPALLLTRIVGPSAEIKAVGKDKKEINEREQLREQFYSGLLELASTKTNRHANASSGKAPWLSASSGTRGVFFMYGVKMNSSSVFLYIDRGPNSGDENLHIFDYLHAKKDEIETEIDMSLSWDRLDNRRACVITTGDFGCGYRDTEEQWKLVYPSLIETMIKFDNCLSPKILDAVDYATRQSAHESMKV